MLTRWILPVVFVVLGILILSGRLLDRIPRATGLRLMIGIVVILMGVHRFVVSRGPKGDRRRFGGEHRRPWEE